LYTFPCHIPVMDMTSNIGARPRTHENAITAEARYGYIPGLDGLRAIAVLIVLVAHFGLSHIVPGGFGVTLSDYAAVDRRSRKERSCGP
jgi:hypothetical protein